MTLTEMSFYKISWLDLDDPVKSCWTFFQKDIINLELIFF